jgi:hypothetical protein
MELRNIGDVGIEIEFSTIERSRRDFQYIIGNNLHGWNLIHDGSSESAALSINGIPVEIDTNNSANALSLFSLFERANSTVYGGELVSPILSGEDNFFQTYIVKALQILSRENSNSLFDIGRSSIHVHVNLGDSYRVSDLKNLVRLLVMYEPFLYKISSFGHDTRCLANDFVFCRPIYSPTVYEYDGGYYPIFSHRTLLSASKKTEFFNYLYKSLYCFEHGGKYVPQRYVGLNFFSLLIRNSIEFRYANTTTKPDWLISWIKLCQAFVRTAYGSEIVIDKERTLDDTSEYGLDEFISFLDLIQLSNPYRDILINLFLESPDIQYPIKHSVVTHVQQFAINPNDLGVEKTKLKLIRGDPKNVKDFSQELDKVKENIAYIKNEKKIEIQLAQNFIVKEYPNIQVFYKFLLDYFGEGFGGCEEIPPPIENRIQYIKRCISNRSVCFLYPLLDVGQSINFIVPPRQYIHKKLSGKQVTLELKSPRSVVISRRGNSFEIPLLNHTSTKSFYVEITDTINDFGMFLEKKGAE